ncbi:MAG: photosystem II protein, Psb35-related [Geitlerinemataceae cyanobacterium]
MTIALIALFVTGFIAAIALGTQTYFKGEMSKPIHERNWNSDGFESIAVAVTAEELDYNQRVPGFIVNS